MDHRRKLFLEGPISRTLATLTFPIILGNILQNGYQLTDAFWIGRLGAPAVAAVSISFPLIFLMTALGSGLAIAGATLCAQYMGAGRQDMVNHVAAQSMIMVTLTSMCLGALGWLFSPSLLKLSGVAPDVYVDGVSFMRVSCIGSIFVFTYAMFQALMSGVGQVKVTLCIVFGTVVLNFAIDPLFIFGWGPMPGLGVTGAALATLITRALATALGLTVLIYGRYGIKLQWKSLIPDMPYVRRAFILGFPGSVDLSMRGLALMAMSFMVASFGTVATAAYGVGSTVLQITMIPAMGLAAAVSILVGQNLGAGKIERAVRITILGAFYSFVILSLGGLFAYLCAPQIVAFFVPHDPRVIAEGTSFIRIMCLAWGAAGIQLSIGASFRASGNMLVSMLITIFSQWVFQFPVAYILSKQAALDVHGLWWSFPMTNVVISSVSIYWFARGSWKNLRLTEERRGAS